MLNNTTDTQLEIRRFIMRPTAILEPMLEDVVSWQIGNIHLNL